MIWPPSTPPTPRNDMTSPLTPKYRHSSFQRPLLIDHHSPMAQTTHWGWLNLTRFQTQPSEPCRYLTPHLPPYLARPISSTDKKMNEMKEQKTPPSISAVVPSLQKTLLLSPFPFLSIEWQCPGFHDVLFSYTKREYSLLHSHISFTMSALRLL